MSETFVKKVRPPLQEEQREAKTHSENQLYQKNR